MVHHKKEKWETALDELVEGVRKIYDGRFQAMILYGSRARGTAEEDSDVDVLVVLNPLEDFWAELSRLQSLVAPISLKHDVVLSAIPVSADEFEEPKTALLVSAKREGICVV